MLKLLALLAAAALLYHLIRSGALFRGRPGAGRGTRRRKPRHPDKSADRDVVDAEFRDLES